MDDYVPLHHKDIRLTSAVVGGYCIWLFQYYNGRFDYNDMLTSKTPIPAFFYFPIDM